MSLQDVTFIIPLRIESFDRNRNCSLSFEYLFKNTDAQIMLMESDSLQYVPRIINKFYQENQEDFDKRVHYKFESLKDSMFHRTRLLNEMLNRVTTPIVVNYDCDVLLPISSYEKAAEMCRADYDLVYPYSFGDNAQWRCFLQDSGHVSSLRTNWDLSSMPGMPWRAEYGFCQFFKTESYKNGFGENESFFAYGPEDVERFERFQKLGYKIGRVENKIFHLEHSRTFNSSGANPFMKHNENLFEKLKKMNKNELLAYYSSEQSVK